MTSSAVEGESSEREGRHGRVTWDCGNHTGGARGTGERRRNCTGGV
jgi:hypothetical protein